MQNYPAFESRWKTLGHLSNDSGFSQPVIEIENAVSDFVSTYLPPFVTLKSICLDFRKRSKDFWDIYFLLEKMSLSDMLRYYEKKYPASNAMIALKAVSYFEDIAHNLDKPQIWHNITFPQLQKRIFQAVQDIDKVFLPYK